jgi:glutamate/aspartate transport system substrate-binding protein
MVNRILPTIASIGCALLLLVGLAHAQEGSRLEHIRQTGTIIIGHRDIGIPFSYYDDQHHPIGYSIDICLHIADAIKSELKLSKLDVSYKEVTAATRIPLVANGTVDMECGSTSNSAVRDQQVAFSDTIFVASPRFVTKMKANLQTLDSLHGKRMSGVAGTATIRQFNELSRRQQLGLIVEPVKDHASAFHLLETDAVEAYGAVDTSAFSMVARSSSPADYFISPPLSIDPFAIVVPKDDPAIKRIADSAIAKLFSSGEIYQLYEKWFQHPLPRFGFTLNMPMSAALKSAIAHPTDSPNPHDYGG